MSSRSHWRHKQNNRALVGGVAVTALQQAGVPSEASRVSPQSPHDLHSRYFVVTGAMRILTHDRESRSTSRRTHGFGRNYPGRAFQMKRSSELRRKTSSDGARKRRVRPDLHLVPISGSVGGTSANPTAAGRGGRATDRAHSGTPPSSLPSPKLHQPEDIRLFAIEDGAAAYPTQRVPTRVATDPTIVVDVCRADRGTSVVLSSESEICRQPRSTLMATSCTSATDRVA